MRHQVTNPIPVVVVGNLSVGGSGKTPVVIALVNRLTQLGLAVAVVSRGYGAKPSRLPLCCDAQTDPKLCGDEPLLIAKRTGVAVIVDPDRPRAVRTAAAMGHVLVVADDGLQHYRMARDLEIAVIGDCGNGRLLPAGPMREPMTRLHGVDMVLKTPSAPDLTPFDKAVYPLAFQPSGFYRVCDDAPVTLSSLSQQSITAVCGIAHPQRFYRSLAQLGLTFTTHSYPDHHSFSAEDFPQYGCVVMTEKDAVKCRLFAHPQWVYLAITTTFSDAVVTACRTLVAQ